MTDNRMIVFRLQGFEQVTEEPRPRSKLFAPEWHCIVRLTFIQRSIHNRRFLFSCWLWLGDQVYGMVGFDWLSELLRAEGWCWTRQGKYWVWMNEG